MKKLFIFLLVPLAVAVYGQNSQPPYKLIAPSELRTDLDFLYQQLQDNHPDLYAHLSKKEADAEKDRLRGLLNHPMNRREFSALLSPFLASFRDGHCFMGTDPNQEELKLYDSCGGKLFPLEVIIHDGKLYSSGSNSTGIKPGDEIQSINGKPAAFLINTLSRFFSGDNEHTATISAGRLFGYGLWVLYGWGTQTEVSWTSGQKTQKANIPGISKNEYFSALFHKADLFVLKLYPQYSLALIVINEYSYVKKAQDFIDSCFTIIQRDGIKHVALDLRKNGGGNSSIGDYLLAHITHKSLTSTVSKTWREGPLMQALDTSNWRYPSFAKQKQEGIKTGKDSYTVNFGPEKPDSLHHPELFTNVDFYLLTSGRTYSSAHMTALSVKCSGLGTIIGQPTGERLDLTGEIAELKLPHTGLSVWIPTAIYKSACGPGQQVGVQPDYEVPVNIRNIIDGKDPELEKLISLIKEKN